MNYFGMIHIIPACLQLLRGSLGLSRDLLLLGLLILFLPLAAMFTFGHPPLSLNITQCLCKGLSHAR